MVGTALGLATISKSSTPVELLENTLGSTMSSHLAECQAVVNTANRPSARGAIKRARPIEYLTRDKVMAC